MRRDRELSKSGRKLRRTGAGLAGAALVAALASSGVGAATASPAVAHKSAPLMDLTVAEASITVPAIPASTIDVAQALGFYHRYGLDVTIDRFTATPMVVDALQGGSVDVGYIDTTSTIELNAENELAIKAFDSPETGNDFLIAANDSISSPAQLNGATFGVSAPGGSDEVDSELVLQHYHVPFSSVKPVTIGAPATRALSLVAGKVSATTMSVATWQTIAGQPGVHIIVTPGQYAKAAPIVSKVDVATTATLQRKKKAILAFTEALMATARYEAKHPTTWAEKDAPLSGDTVDQLEAAVPYFVKDWCANGCIETPALAETQAFIYANTPALAGVPTIKLSNWVDTYFTTTALKALGKDPGYL